MATYQISAPDGSKYEITAPDSASQSDVLAYAQAHHVASAAPASARPDSQFGDIWKSGLSGLTQGITGAAGLLNDAMPGNLAQNIVHYGSQALGGPSVPATLDVTKSLDDTIQKNIAPYHDPQTTAGKYARTLGQFAPGLIAGPEGILPRLASVAIPAVGSEALGQATEGTPYEGAARFAGGLAGAGVSSSLERLVNSAGASAASAAPSAAASARGLEPVGPLGRISSQLLAVPSGVGAKTLQTAYQAGRAGGAPAQAFIDNLTGNVAPETVLAKAKAALSGLKDAKNAAYRSGMADVAADQTVLSFKPIDTAMEDLGYVSTFKGVDIKPQVAGVRNDVQDLIDKWKALDPAEYHTPEGFDALKQQVGDLRDAQPYGSQGRLVVDRAYNAVKDAIVDQAPSYANTMRSYWDASNQINDIQRTLSLNPKATVDTALRKLQSTMRDGVNTNFGQRAQLVQAMDKDGTLMSSLAGQAAHQWAPQGLARAVASGDAFVGTAAALAHNPVLAAGTLASLPLMSPRLMGSAAYGLGSAARLGRQAAPSLLRHSNTLPLLMLRAAASQ